MNYSDTRSGVRVSARRSLNAAQGILLGAVVGSVMWVGIVAGIVTMVRSH